jgi:hypothetical protein
MRTIRDSGVGSLAISAIDTQSNPRAIGGMMGMSPNDIEATAVNEALKLVEAEGVTSWTWSDFNKVEGVIQAGAKKFIQKEYGM